LRIQFLQNFTLQTVSATYLFFLTSKFLQQRASRPDLRRGDAFRYRPTPDSEPGFFRASVSSKANCLSCRPIREKKAPSHPYAKSPHSCQIPSFFISPPKPFANYSPHPSLAFSTTTAHFRPHPHCGSQAQQSPPFSITPARPRTHFSPAGRPIRAAKGPQLP
jgi:hypothetical protein